MLKLFFSTPGRTRGLFVLKQDIQNTKRLAKGVSCYLSLVFMHRVITAIMIMQN